MQLYVKEITDSSNETAWMGRTGAYDNLKVRVVQSTSPEMSRRIAEDPLQILPGGTLANLASARAARDGNTSDILIKDIKINNTLMSTTTAHQTVKSGEYKLHDFPIETNFYVLNDQPRHLSYFAVSYIDDQAHQDRESRTLTRPAASGKLVSEVVIDERSTTKTATYFERESGAPYFGPVHQNRGSTRYVTGLKPGTSELKNLKLVSVPNIKIKDMRVVEDFKEIDIDFKNRDTDVIAATDSTKSKIYYTKQEDDSYLTNLYLNRQKNGSAKFIFGLDLYRVFQKHSLYSKIFGNAERTMVREILDSCIIRSLKVVRRRINRELTNPNKLGIPLKEKPFPTFNEEPIEHIVASYENIKIGNLYNSTGLESKNVVYDKYSKNNKLIGSIKVKKLFVNNSSDINYFQCSDNQLSEVTDGVYQYGVEIEFEDRTYLYLKRQLESLRTAIKQYEHYKHTAIKAGYNPNTKKYLASFVRESDKLSDGQNYSWTVLLKELSNVINIFMGHDARVSDRRIEDLMRTLYSCSSPISCKPGELAVLSSFAKEMYQNLISKFRDKEDREILILNRKSSAFFSHSERGQQPSVFKIMHYFGDPMNGRSNTDLYSCFVDKSIRDDFGYDYINTVVDEGQINSTNDFVTFKAQDFAKRFDVETYRFFTNRNQNINIKVGNTMYTNRDFILRNKYRYLSPSVISLGRGKQVNLIEEDMNIFNEEKNISLLLDIMNYNIGRERLDTTDYSNLEFNKTLDSYLSFSGLARQNKVQQEEGETLEQKAFASSFADASRYVGASAMVLKKEKHKDNEEINRLLNDENLANSYIDPYSNPNLTRNRHISAEPVGANVMLDLIGTSYLKMLEPVKNIQNWNLRNSANVISFLDKVKSRETTQRGNSSINLSAPTGRRAEIPKERQKIIKELPFQLKALLHQGLGKANRFNFDIDNNTYNPLIDANKFILFWLMHGQLVEVQALIELPEQNNKSYANHDSWQPLDAATWQQINNKGDVLCRLVPYKNKEMLGTHPDILNLPIYNEFFIINGGTNVSSEETKVSTSKGAEARRLIDRLDTYVAKRIDIEYTTTNMMPAARKTPNAYVHTIPTSQTYRGPLKFDGKLIDVSGDVSAIVRSSRGSGASGGGMSGGGY